MEGVACHFCGVPGKTSGLGGVLQRRYELDSLKRSIAMLTPGQQALSREEAMKLLGEFTDVQERLDRLTTGRAGPPRKPLPFAAQEWVRLGYGPAEPALCE